jgi:hypothetical protein
MESPRIDRQPSRSARLCLHVQVEASPGTVSERVLRRSAASIEQCCNASGTGARQGDSYGNARAPPRKMGILRNRSYQKASLTAFVLGASQCSTVLSLSLTMLSIVVFY